MHIRISVLCYFHWFERMSQLIVFTDIASACEGEVTDFEKP